MQNVLKIKDDFVQLVSEKTEITVKGSDLEWINDKEKETLRVKRNDEYIFQCKWDDLEDKHGAGDITELISFYSNNNYFAKSVLSTTVL